MGKPSRWSLFLCRFSHKWEKVEDEEGTVIAVRCRRCRRTIPQAGELFVNHGYVDPTLSSLDQPQKPLRP